MSPSCMKLVFKIVAYHPTVLWLLIRLLTVSIDSAARQSWPSRAGRAVIPYRRSIGGSFQRMVA